MHNRIDATHCLANKGDLILLRASIGTLRTPLDSPWDVSHVVAEPSALVFALSKPPGNPYGTRVFGVGATGFEPVTSAV
jgi:hypothetical protein